MIWCLRINVIIEPRFLIFLLWLNSLYLLSSVQERTAKYIMGRPLYAFDTFFTLHIGLQPAPRRGEYLQHNIYIGFDLVKPLVITVCLCIRVFHVIMKINFFECFKSYSPPEKFLYKHKQSHNFLFCTISPKVTEVFRFYSVS